MIIESNNPQMILDEMSDKGSIMYKGYSNSARESLSAGINLLSCSKVCFSNSDMLSYHIEVGAS